MVHHVAYCVARASALAGILALVSHARSVSGTVVIEHALWTTADRGISVIVGEARADSVVALSVRATGGWIAQIYFRWLDWLLKIGISQ